MLAWRLASFVSTVAIASLASAAPFAYVPNLGNGNPGSGTVSVIDIASNTVIASIPNVGTNPWFVATSPRTARAFIRSDDGVYAIDTFRNVRVGSPALQVTGRAGIALSSSADRLYYGFRQSAVGYLCALRTSDMTDIGCAQAPTASLLWGVSVTPDNQFVYATDWGNSVDAGRVLIFQREPLTYVTSVTVGVNPWSVTFSPNGARAYVPNQGSASVSVIDTASQTLVDSIGLGNGSLWAAISPNGERLYVTSAGTVSVVDTTNNTVVASPAVGSSPIGISIEPTGARVYVANSVSNSVSVLSTATNAVVATIPVGIQPYSEGQFIGGGKLLDIDGDGEVLATTDMLLLMRWQLGIRGQSLITGIGFPPNALRTTFDAIETYLRELESLGAAR